MLRKSTLIIFIVASVAYSSSAWVYPEHRRITLRAIEKLDENRKNLLDEIWAQARIGYEYRLCESVADVTQDVKPQYLDYAAWPAIGGDHSVSPENMTYNILKSDWILKVADVAARLKNGIAAAKRKSEIENELRNSDLRLLRVDPEYVSRAGANNGHFMLARPEINIAADDYFKICYSQGTDLNLIGIYAYFHFSALEKASRLATETLTPEQRSELALAALADEAYSLHFLEDGFSAGHVAGTWGNASQRKGTHDYYDEHGLDIISWNGERMVIMGDAYMRPVDVEKAADIIAISLSQLLDVAGGKSKLAFGLNREVDFLPDTFNTSAAMVIPEYYTNQTIENLCNEILVNLPVPGLSSGLGEAPRFRSELGPFVGLAPAAILSGLFGGFGETQTENGFVPSLEVAFHVGLGTDGVLNKSGDGLIFLDLGWRLDGASTYKVRPGLEYKEFGSILSAVPSRESLFFRVRLPFYVIPGDMVILAPVLLIFSPNAFNKLVATASQGGLIPWQSGIMTQAGRIQFMLGREIGVYFCGILHGQSAFLVPDDNLGPGEMALVSARSTKLDFPFLEYRPVRTFSSKQSASFMLQLYTGIDIPGKVTMKVPADADPVKLKPIWSVGVRLGFDWRYYYSNK